MRKTILSLVIVWMLILPSMASAQPPSPAYHVPDKFTFDYEVVQVVTRGREKMDTTEMHYYFTRSGEYAAVGAREKDGDHFIVYTKDDATIFIDLREKTISVLKMKNLPGGQSFFGKKNLSGTGLVKTGQTRQMYGYKAEEYKQKDSRGKEVFCWYARTGFNTQLIKTMGKGVGAPTLNEPDQLLVEAAAADEHSAARSTFLVTRSISDRQYNFSTKGYRVTN